MKRFTMQQLFVNVVCSAIVAVALAAVVWTAVSGQLEAQGLDAIFLIAVCLLVAVVFSWVPVRAVRQAGPGWLGKFKKRNVPAGEAAKAAPVTTAEPRERV